MCAKRRFCQRITLKGLIKKYISDLKSHFLLVGGLTFLTDINLQWLIVLRLMHYAVAPFTIKSNLSTSLLSGYQSLMEFLLDFIHQYPTPANNTHKSILLMGISYFHSRKYGETFPYKIFEQYSNYP